MRQRERWAAVGPAGNGCAGRGRLGEARGRREGGAARSSLPAPPRAAGTARPGAVRAGGAAGTAGGGSGPGEARPERWGGGVSAQGPAGGARGVRDGSGVEVGAAGSWWPAPGHGESGCEAGGFGAAFG